MGSIKTKLEPINQDSMISFVSNRFKKRDMIQQFKNQEIERENKILLKKIFNIM
jgi:hypothetical protein